MQTSKWIVPFLSVMTMMVLLTGFVWAGSPSGEGEEVRLRLDEIFRLVQKNHPHILAARRQLATAERELQLAKGETAPTITVTARPLEWEYDHGIATSVEGRVRLAGGTTFSVRAKMEVADGQGGYRLSLSQPLNYEALYPTEQRIVEKEHALTVAHLHLHQVTHETILQVLAALWAGERASQEYQWAKADKLATATALAEVNSKLSIGAAAQREVIDARIRHEQALLRTDQAWREYHQQRLVVADWLGLGDSDAIPVFPSLAPLLSDIVSETADLHLVAAPESMVATRRKQFAVNQARANLEARLVEHRPDVNLRADYDDGWSVAVELSYTLASKQMRELQIIEQEVRLLDAEQQYEAALSQAARQFHDQRLSLTDRLHAQEIAALIYERDRADLHQMHRLAEQGLLDTERLREQERVVARSSWDYEEAQLSVALVYLELLYLAGEHPQIKGLEWLRW